MARMLTELTEAQRGQAMARFAFLRPHVEGGVPLSKLAAQKDIPSEPRDAGYRDTNSSDLLD